MNKDLVKKNNQEEPIMSVFDCKSLNFRYEAGTNGRQVIDNIDLQIGMGEFVCFIGPSGSGKSTILNMLGMIEQPDSGQIQFNGNTVGGLSEKDLNQIRRQDIGFIFQDFQLIEVLTVEENVEYFLYRQKVAKKERRAIVERCLQETGLWPFRGRLPGELSGGQKQRVAIARALAKRPKVIIADEPTASLDINTGRQIMQILADLNRKHGVTVVVASHDQMVLEYVSRTVHVLDGKIVFDQEVASRAS